MLRKLFFALFAFTIYIGANAQEVESNPYGFMLNTLLDHSVPEVSVDEIPQNKEVILLDAREVNEFWISKIATARWVGYDDFSLDRVQDIPKDKKIVVYCSVGYRSEKVAEKLLKAGFNNVSNLYGGIFEWVNQGRIVFDSLEKKTSNVHAYNRAWGVWLKKGNKIYR